MKKSGVKLTLKKKEFLDRFVQVLKEDLEKHLPEEDFLSEYQERAWAILHNRYCHINNLKTYGR